MEAKGKRWKACEKWGKEKGEFEGWCEEGGRGAVR